MYWIHTSTEKTEKIECVQKRAVKLLTRKYDSNYCDLLKQHGGLSPASSVS